MRTPWRCRRSRSWTTRRGGSRAIRTSAAGSSSTSRRPGRRRELAGGVLPIGGDARLLGILTDRDITIRATAEGKDPNSTPVREVMSSEVVACFEDDDEQDAAAKMQEHQ